MNHLSESSLAELGAGGIRIPAFDRSRVHTGVVHFGPGAFHRVHQACYLDTALASDPRWAISEISLHSTGVRDALTPQQGLYTIAVLDASSDFRVIGSIKEVLVARESPAAVLERLVNPAVHLVTATITEKGYCLSADGGLDLAHADIQHDLLHPELPRTFVGYVARALQLRRTLRIAPPNIVSCDNLVDNGKRLKRAVVEFASQHDADLAQWIDAEVAFPCSMVDSITPATDDALKARVAARLGVTDRWPVQREFFTQWVIEDMMQGPGPDWAALGVNLTDDIAGFERAKLRLLNGAHSSLAYLGSLAGHEAVAQAMTDAALAQFVRTLMETDIRPTLTPPRGLDLRQYIDTILQRFRNPAIRHLLAQIAWDGSQKLPFRLLGTIADNLSAGRPIGRLCIPVAAWLHFVRRKAARGKRVTDPLAERLFDVAGACTGDAAHDVALFLALVNVFPPSLAGSVEFQSAMNSAYRRLAAVTRPDELQEALRST